MFGSAASELGDAPCARGLRTEATRKRHGVAASRLSLASRTTEQRIASRARRAALRSSRGPHAVRKIRRTRRAPTSILMEGQVSQDQSSKPASSDDRIADPFGMMRQLGSASADMMSAYSDAWGAMLKNSRRPDRRSDVEGLRGSRSLAQGACSDSRGNSVGAEAAHLLRSAGTGSVRAAVSGASCSG